MLRVGGAAPPAASRCSARASLRTPSRGDPPLGCGLASGLYVARALRMPAGTSPAAYSGDSLWHSTWSAARMGPSGESLWHSIGQPGKWVPSGEELLCFVRDREATAAEEQLEIEQDRIGWPDTACELSATQARLQAVELVALDPQHFVDDQP